MSKELKRGTYVSRSAYQKVVEEKNRLLRDIHILVSIFSFNRMKVTMKWRKKFEDNKRLHELLKAAAEEYLKGHPELRRQRIDATTQAQLNTVGPKSFEASKRLKAINKTKL